MGSTAQTKCPITVTYSCQPGVRRKWCESLEIRVHTFQITVLGYPSGSFTCAGITHTGPYIGGNELATQTSANFELILQPHHDGSTCWLDVLPFDFPQDDQK